MALSRLYYYCSNSYNDHYHYDYNYHDVDRDYCYSHDDDDDCLASFCMSVMPSALEFCMACKEGVLARF